MKCDGYWKLDTVEPEFYVIELSVKETEAILDLNCADCKNTKLGELQDILRQAYDRAYS